MSLNYPKPGANHVPSFEISGLPYITRSAGAEVSTTVIKHSFPYVTRFFQIGNPTGNDLRVGFTENGVSSAETSNYFVVGANTSASLAPRIEIRCKDLFFLRDGGQDAGFEIIAGLTPIKADQFPVLSGTVYSFGFGDPPTTSSWPGVG